jgi:hypothetical protein
MTIAAASPSGSTVSVGAVNPSIVSEPCTSNRSTWVHVYSKDAGTFCLGFKGTWVFNHGNGR